MTTYRILAQIGPAASSERDAARACRAVTVGRDEGSIGGRRVIELFIPRYLFSQVGSYGRATRGGRGPGAVTVAGNLYAGFAPALSRAPSL